MFHPRNFDYTILEFLSLDYQSIQMHMNPVTPTTKYILHVQRSVVRLVHPISLASNLQFVEMIIISAHTQTNTFILLVRIVYAIHCGLSFDSMNKIEYKIHLTPVSNMYIILFHANSIKSNKQQNNRNLQCTLRMNFKPISLAQNLPKGFASYIYCSYQKKIDYIR